MSPLWHGTELARVFAYGAAEPIWLTIVHVLYLARAVRRRLDVDPAHRRAEAEQVTSTDSDLIATVPHLRPMRSLYAGNASSVMQRGWFATRSTNWLVVVSGFFEPIFYLLSLGIGLGAMVGDVHDVERPAHSVRGVHRAGAAGDGGHERRRLRLHLERLLQDALRQALRGDARPPRSARSTSRSARSCSRCCAARSTRSAS